MLTMKTNLKQVEDDLDTFVDAVLTRAVPRALNALREQAQTAGLREIAKVYEIGPRTMERYVSVKPATAGDASTEISVKGRGFPLNVFQPVKTATGVSVKVKGRRFTVPHSFVIAKFGGNVFARGSYGGKYGGEASGESFGRFQFGRSRLPISKLYSFSPPDTLANRQVQDAMDARVEEQAAKVLSREIAAAKRGF